MTFLAYEAERNRKVAYKAEGPSVRKRTVAARRRQRRRTACRPFGDREEDCGGVGFGDNEHGDDDGAVGCRAARVSRFFRSLLTVWQSDRVHA
jgi:hypothetical protein